MFAKVHSRTSCFVMLCSLFFIHARSCLHSSSSSTGLVFASLHLLVVTSLSSFFFFLSYLLCSSESWRRGRAAAPCSLWRCSFQKENRRQKQQYIYFPCYPPGAQILRHQLRSVPPAKVSPSSCHSGVSCASVIIIWILANGQIE